MAVAAAAVYLLYSTGNRRMTEELQLHSLRARKARLAGLFTKNFVRIYGLLTFLLIAAGAYCLTLGDLPRAGYWALAAACALAVVLLWPLLPLLCIFFIVRGIVG